jgi:hypothetical protein
MKEKIMVVVVVTARRWRVELIFCFFEYVTETNGCSATTVLVVLLYLQLVEHAHVYD